MRAFEFIVSFGWAGTIPARRKLTKKAALDAAWAESLPPALRNSVEFIAGACAKAKDDPDACRNPMLISAVAGALKLCAEALYTGRVIDARIAGLPVRDQLLIH